MTEEKKVHPLTSFIKSSSVLINPLKKGESYEATLIYKDNQKALFDINGKAIGILFGIEMMNARDIIKNISVGSSSAVTVLVEENEDGYAEVSLMNAIRHQNWQDIKKVKENDEIVTVKITSANSGGLLTEIFGIKAFIPVSQLSIDHYPHVEDGNKNKILEELKKLIGQELAVKVLDFNPREEKLILSEREVLEETVRKSLERYQVGDVVEVMVSGIADFGVFVRLVDDPNIEGLVHISEIDHKLIDSPKEVVRVGDSLKAKIIEIKDGRVSLSFKALKPNPWEKAETYFSANQEVAGTVLKFNQFGALIGLPHDLQGLIHISNFQSPEQMKEKLKIGNIYNFVITQIKASEKRIILTLKNSCQPEKNLYTKLKIDEQ